MWELQNVPVAGSHLKYQSIALIVLIQHLPEGFDVYQYAKWLPNIEQLELIEKEISNGVASSNLPTDIKDEYADRNYNRTMPLVQRINCILEEYSLLRLMQGIKAGSLALRNSDFIDKELKHQLLDSVLQSIKQLTHVLIALTPVLAKNNHVQVEGATFTLAGPYSKQLDKKLNEMALYGFRGVRLTTRKAVLKLQLFPGA